ncbi:MAG: T9SS type A sorting domain-containing protein [Bacteroidota bacterium]
MNSTDANLSPPLTGFGYQNTHSGANMGGFSTYIENPPQGTNYREYIQARVAQPLLAGKYRVSFYVSLANSSKRATGNMGAYISTIRPLQSTTTWGPLNNLTPQIVYSSIISDTTNWVLVTDTFTASGGEMFITIGNFDRDNVQPRQNVQSAMNTQSNFAYYFIDDLNIETYLSYIPVSAVPQPHCLGQTVTLSVVNPYDSVMYNWSSSQGTFTCLDPFCKQISFTNTYNTATTFQVSVNLPITCTQYGGYSVNPVISTMTVNAGADKTVCVGPPVLLSGTASNATLSYWNDITNNVQLCTNCISYNYTPTAGTTFLEFVGYDGATGCTYRDTMKITAVPLSNVQITPVLGDAANILCTPVQYSVSASASLVSYNWQSIPVSAGSSQPLYTVNWPSLPVSNSGSVLVTVSDVNGCIGYDTLVNNTPCCNYSSSEALITINNGNTSSLISAVQQICPSCVNTTTNTLTHSPAFPIELNINGVFTINQQLVMVNWPSINMGANAQIDIPAAKSLTLTNCTTSVKCGYLWNGIYINGTTAILKTTTNTLLQQARNAVVSVNGGVFAVENTTLRNCVKGIVVQPYSAANHIGLVRSTVFEMPGTFLPALPALPTTTTKTLAGVEINSVSNITIGDAAQTSYKNLFNGLFKGVYAKASGTTIRNAEFTNIVASNSVTMSGTAVHCEGLKGVPYTQFINVGGTLANQPCKFDNNRRGVVVSLAHNVNVTGNSFTNFNNWILAPAVGISVTNCIGRTITIGNNRISNSSTANRLPNGITVTDVSGSTVSITNNRLLQCSSTASSYGEQVGTGITVQNTTAAPVALTVLNNDTISRFAYGITLTNISNTALALVKSNRVLFAKPKTNYNTQLHYGIGLINCTQIKADSNRIVRTTSGVWQSSDAATLATNLRGVYVTNSSGCIVSQNTFTGLGEGVHANSICPATFFVCNSFNQSYRACMFTGANSSNAAYLNDQTNFQSTVYPTGNVFVGSATSDLAGSIRLVSNINNPINWYYIGTIPTTGTFLGFGSLTGAGNTPVISPNSTSPCNLTPFLIAQGGDQRDMLAGSQISVSEEVQTTDMIKEMATKDAHLLLLQNPDWLNLNTPEDTDYQQFYAATDTTEIGKTNHTEQAALVDDTVQAVQLNTSLSGTTDLTETHKTVFEIYNRSWLLDNTSLSATDTAVLLPIALQHPAQSGEAVYTARVMLGITVDDATGNYSYRLAEPETIPVIAADVFPNPAATQVTVKGNFNEADVLTFTLVDLTGRVVTNQQLPAGNSTINVDLSTLQPGAYLYQITVNEVMVQSERLVIAR